MVIPPVASPRSPASRSSRRPSFCSSLWSYEDRYWALKAQDLAHAAADFPSGWWLTYPFEKYESQIGSSSQLLGRIKHVPNHQLAMVFLQGTSCPWSIASTPCLRPKVTRWIRLTNWQMCVAKAKMCLKKLVSLFFTEGLLVYHHHFPPVDHGHNLWFIL
jgi:hypothetical protein